MTRGDTSIDVRQLRRLRWAVRAILTTGLAASIAANILHARTGPASQTIAAWSPLALLLTVEMITRVPTHHRLLGPLRVTATVIVAGIAAWVSYWHMAAVAARYGETGPTPYLLPFSVDGLVLVATISLVEISARITATSDTATTTHPTPSATVPPTSPIAQSWVADLGAPAPAWDAVFPPLHPPAYVHTSGSTRVSPPGPDRESGIRGVADDRVALRRDGDVFGRDGAPAVEERRELHQSRLDKPVQTGAPAGTAAAVAYWRRHRPGDSPAQIAELVGRSERTVRRHWATTPSPSADS